MKSSLSTWKQERNALRKALQQMKWDKITTQPVVCTFNWIRLLLVGPVFCHVCVLIYCYCYVCRLSLLGFPSSSVIAGRASTMEVCVVPCVCFDVFDMTSLIKGHWKSPSLPRCLKLPHIVSHNLRVLDWCEMCFFEWKITVYTVSQCVSTSLCFVCSFFPLCDSIVQNNCHHLAIKKTPVAPMWPKQTHRGE